MRLLGKTVCAALLLALLCSRPLLANDQEALNQGKVLMFDRKWENARLVFQKFTLDYPKSGLVAQAYFYSARCLQLQGKVEDALRAHEVFVQKFPSEPFLAAEARNAIVELATTLVERGNASYRNRVIASLSDANKDVRYFAAIRCSRLKDPAVTSKVVPVLKEIIRSEKEKDLVDRARIALLRLDPTFLAKAPPPQAAPPQRKKDSDTAGRGNNKLFHIRVYEEGVAQPKVELNIPVSLAQLAVASFDESTKVEMKKKGIDVDNIWEDLKRLGPTNILTIRDGNKVVKIWIE